MKLLYCAIDQVVPGTKGGSIHVQAVAEGLAARGHEVHVLTGEGAVGFPAGAVHWHAMRPPLGDARLRWLRSPAVLRAARQWQPDVIIERYYNFGGEGLRAAREVGALSVLEVNAPVVDYAGSPKRTLDRLLLVEPMRRWRDWQCRVADVIVSPSRAILPDWLPANRIVEVEWGADTVRFHPGASGDPGFTRKPGELVAVFAGAFRAWHGAIHLAEAMQRLQRRGVSRIGAVFAGDGPELARVREAARGLDRVVFLGSVPHDRMPALLAAADIGVAPFDPDAHAPLSLGFYWSPLKVFEYMASGLPVVAPSIDGMRRIVDDGREGLLYDRSNPDGLADTLARLQDDTLRHALARRSRERAEREYGWDRHCARLEAAMLEAVARRVSAGGR